MPRHRGARAMKFTVGVSVRIKPGGDLDVPGAIGAHVSQAEASERIGVPGLVHEFASGRDCCVLAYGQTGSGKTHTLLGPPGVLTERALEQGGLPPEWGCWPRAILQAMAVPGVELELWAVEIYFENVFDLLDEKKAVKTGGRVAAKGFGYDQTSKAQYDEHGKWIPPLAAGKDGEFRVSAAASKLSESVVEGQSKVRVQNAADVVRVGRTVEMTRAAQSHALNDRSSRSHAVLGAEMVRRQGGKVLRSRLLVCDLAGSERIKKTGVTGQVQDEARAINASLSALQRVAQALSQKSKFVPYRDSALTAFLRPALGGASKTQVVVTVSSDPAWKDETLNSLRFAREMGRVENSVQAQRVRSAADEQAALASELQALLDQLQGVQLGGLRTDTTQAARDEYMRNLQQYEHFKARLDARRQGRLEGKAGGGDEKLCEEKVDLHRAALERMQSRSERHGAGLFQCPLSQVLAQYERVQELEAALAASGAPVERTVLPESVRLAQRVRRILHPSLLGLQ
uniref:Kinesin-like protein n=1 Tax=Alexandrium monilatum TaxID=311494 RepID=A0A7S4SVB8_9DINO|mmetsp:Transcript_14665/g.43847  ORF Transcript_14665/g.43847 Transcript_14665/m.43847 type:complete len:514 (-) Transcript_14665:83-1624(-)